MIACGTRQSAHASGPAMTVTATWLPGAQCPVQVVAVAGQHVAQLLQRVPKVLLAILRHGGLLV